MLQIKCLGRAVCAALVCVLAVSAASSALADQIEFDVISQDGGYYAEAMASAAGSTSFKMRKAGETGWDEFEQFGDGFEFESDWFSSLGALNSGLGGDYTMQIVHGSGASEYTFTIDTVSQGSFPSNPVLDSVPSRIPRRHTFAWTWAGSADVKYVEYAVWVDHDETGVELDYEPGDPGFGDLSHDADFGTSGGSGVFFIDYVNGVGDLITNWTLASGDELFGNNGPLQYVASEDKAEFQVSPAGDCNLDGVVDDADLSLLLAHWNEDVTGDPNGGCGKGEFNAAAPVDDSDLSLLLSNWAGAGAVPEPATLALLAVGAVALIRRRMR